MGDERPGARSIAARTRTDGGTETLMDTKRDFEERPPMATSGLVGIQLAAQNRERILARIAAEREARQAARNHRGLARQDYAMG